MVGRRQAARRAIGGVLSALAFASITDCLVHFDDYSLGELCPDAGSIRSIDGSAPLPDYVRRGHCPSDPPLEFSDATLEIR